MSFNVTSIPVMAGAVWAQVNLNRLRGISSLRDPAYDKDAESFRNVQKSFALFKLRLLHLDIRQINVSGMISCVRPFILFPI